MGIFDDHAILFVCARVASYSGDARKAFQVCKRAAHISQIYSSNNVTLSHVQQAFTELFGSLFSNAISLATLYQKLVLITICLELKQNLLEYASMKNLF